MLFLSISLVECIFHLIWHFSLFLVFLLFFSARVCVCLCVLFCCFFFYLTETCMCFVLSYISYTLHRAYSRKLHVRVRPHHTKMGQFSYVRTTIDRSYKSQEIVVVVVFLFFASIEHMERVPREQSMSIKWCV